VSLHGLVVCLLVFIALCSPLYAEPGAPTLASSGMEEFRLKYIKPTDDLLAIIRDILSPSGKATALERSNSVIVRDTSDAVERVRKVLAALDRMPEQVAIEARIVEISEGLSRELGITWNGATSSTSGNVLGGLGTYGGTMGINLPTTATSGMTIGFGVVSDKLSFDISLAAMEQQGTAHLLSSPRIIVIDNEEAVITSGTDIIVPSIRGPSVPYSPQVDGNTDKRSPNIYSAGLELTVTPRAIESDLIALTIRARRDEFDYTRDVNGYPTRDSRGVSTKLLVRNGATVAIGGLYVKREQRTETQVPILSAIPVLGYLFKHTERSDTRSELLIFLTPVIIKGNAGLSGSMMIKEQ